jgi:hypothetical protein
MSCKQNGRVYLTMYFAGNRSAEGAASSGGPRAPDKDWMKKRRQVMGMAEGADPAGLRSEFGL